MGAAPGSGLSQHDPIIRRSGRVLLFDRADRLLLFRLAHPDRDVGRQVWFTVGGGAEPGETYEECALRELREETGMAGVPLGPCVWTGDALVPWQDRWVHVQARFFLARAETAVIHRGGWTDEEVEMVAEHRWWTVPELTASGDLFSPRRLPGLVGPLLTEGIPGHPIDVRG